MRGRRGRSSSSVSQKQARMPLRKQEAQDGSDSEQDEAPDDRGDDVQKCDHELESAEMQQDEFSSSLLSSSSSRGKHKRERGNKSKSKEMTEEEMMDLALRLSEKEASVAALRLQQEEEAMMKAIQESMVGQIQPSRLSEASLRICRRKLSHSNGRTATAMDQEDVCSEMELRRGGAAADERNKRNKKRKRKEGSPPPDLSQSSCSSEFLSVHLDSPQSSDSTQIDGWQLQKSPVFPSSGCRAEVHVPRLSQDLLDSCRTSGFVVCPPDSWRCSGDLVSKTDQEGTDPGPVALHSPVFGGNTRGEASPRSCRPEVSDCNSGFMFCSQESLGPSVGPPEDLHPTDRPASPVFLETSRGQACCTSPVISRTGRPQKIPLDEQKLSGPDHQGNTTRTRDPSQSLRLGIRTDQDQDVPLSRSPEKPTHQHHLGFAEAKEPSESVGRQVSGSDLVPEETSRAWNSANMELSSDMTLLWSDDDTPPGSPSPVFPEERPLHRADSQDASLDLHTDNLLPSTVSYYWGVPFCPRGLDPDRYTEVILDQMEVYEKSLKKAQRGLLRKAEWGGAVLPQVEKSSSVESPSDSPEQVVHQRRGLRLRGRKLREEEEEEEEEEETGRRKERAEEEEGGGDRKEEGESRGGGGGGDDDCEVCPETQLSGSSEDDDDDDRSEDLMVPPRSGASPHKLGFQCEGKKSPEQQEEEELLKEEDQEEEMEVDGSEDGTMKANILVSSSRKQNVEEDRGGPVVEEMQDRGLQRSVVEEVQDGGLQRVDCPICQQSFPVKEIETHAAFCDGEVVAMEAKRPNKDCYQVSLKPCRKRTRRAAAGETSQSATTGRGQEKCYICQKMVPLRDYSRHTELCIQRQTTKTAAANLHSHPKGNLLLALEQTESRASEAGPSGSTLQSGDVIDLRDDDDDDDDDEEGGGVRISSSPIRSFTPISEAVGCLVDFKCQQQQQVKKQRQRRR